jgi:hypothetical protein
VGGVTVMVAASLFPSLVAVIVTGPPAYFAVTSPVFDTVASAVLLEVHVIAGPSSTTSLEFRSVAVSCTLAPTASDLLAGVTSTDAT